MHFLSSTVALQRYQTPYALAALKRDMPHDGDSGALTRKAEREDGMVLAQAFETLAPSVGRRACAHS